MFPHVFRETVCSHYGILTIMVKAWWAEGGCTHVRLFLATMTAQKFFDFLFSKDVSHESVPGDLSCGGALTPLVSVFGTMHVFCGSHNRSGIFGRSEIGFVWQGHVSKRLLAAGALLHARC